MIKKTILIILLSILVISCGRKGDPEYISKLIGSLRFKDSKVFVGIGLFNKTELIVFSTNPKKNCV